MDWAKYTDEGWYGDAAIRHYQLGHWYVPGDFNPAAALPVWPLLELALFRVTGGERGSGARVDGCRLRAHVGVRLPADAAPAGDVESAARPA